MKTVQYGLRNKKTGDLLSYDPDDCILVISDRHPTWLVNNPQQAEWVRCNNTPDYNADYDTPSVYDYVKSELEVVSLITTTTPVCVTIPTVREFYEKKYKESNPAHWAAVQAHLDLRLEDMGYSWYDYQEAVNNGLFDVSNGSGIDA